MMPKQKVNYQINKIKNSNKKYNNDWNYNNIDPK